MIKYRPLRAALLLAFVTAPAAGQAQQPQASPTPALAVASSQRCELHVWGGERFQAITTTMLSSLGVIGGLLEAATQGDNNQLNRSRLGAALDTRGQAEALASLDLPATLGIPGYEVITHEEAMDPKVAGRNGRRAASLSPCYAELMVTRVLYQKAPLYGRSLRASFLYRQFGAGAKPTFTFAGRGGNGLSVFPAKDDAQVEAANAEIVSVFKANFKEYVKNLLKRRDRGRRG